MEIVPLHAVAFTRYAIFNILVLPQFGIVHFRHIHVVIITDHRTVVRMCGSNRQLLNSKNWHITVLSPTVIFQLAEMSLVVMGFLVGFRWNSPPHFFPSNCLVQNVRMLAITPWYADVLIHSLPLPLFGDVRHHDQIAYGA